MLRGILGAAWTAHSERLGVSGSCECGGTLQFRQHQRWQVHTVLAGRDVRVEVQYGHCAACHGGRVPVLAEMRVDEKGSVRLHHPRQQCQLLQPFGEALLVHPHLRRATGGADAA